jgi:AbrB family looped-hinge helix DNA binding protein
VKITLSSKGQFVLPLAARNKYGLKAGDSIDLILKKDEMKLVPARPKRRKARIIKDPITGMAVLTCGPGAPVITSEMVNKALEDFP